MYKKDFLFNLKLNFQIRAREIKLRISNNLQVKIIISSIISLARVIATLM